MEIMILIALAILIARYAQKRSKIIVSFYSILFSAVLVLSLFTTDIAGINSLMQGVFGEDTYLRISTILQKPCTFLYSVSAAISIAEILMAIVVALMVTERATVTIARYIKSRVRPKRTEDIKKEIVVQKEKAERKIFLRYCRLLD